MKNLIHLLFAALCAFALSGCMSMPKNFDAFSRSIDAEELVLTVATPWGTQQLQAKRLRTTTDALGGGESAGKSDYTWLEDPTEGGDQVTAAPVTTPATALGTPATPPAAPQPDPAPVAPPGSN